MTTDRMTVRQAVPPVGAEELFRHRAKVALAQGMAFEVEGLVGAAQGQHTPERTTGRHGYRDRPLPPRLGTLDLRVPHWRHGTDFASLLQPRRVSERALPAGIHAAWSGGLGTRPGDDLVPAVGMTG